MNAYSLWLVISPSACYISHPACYISPSVCCAVLIMVMVQEAGRISKGAIPRKSPTAATQEIHFLTDTTIAIAILTISALPQMQAHSGQRVTI